MHKKLGGDTDSWPQLTQRMQTSVVFNNKSWEKERMVGLGAGWGMCVEQHSEWWHLSSKSPLCDGVLLAWKWLNTCLTKRSTETVPCFDSLECVAFPLLIKLLSQPMNFLPFSHWFSYPSFWREGVTWMVLGCWLGLSHYRKFYSMYTHGRMFPDSRLVSSIFCCVTIPVFRHAVCCTGIPAIMNTSCIVQIIF